MFLWAKQLLDDFFLIAIKMPCNFSNDTRECSRSKSIVVWNGEMMLTLLLGRESQMAAGLASYDVSESRELFCKVAARNISRQLHTEMVSSRT